jgi:predicted transcriptional regulator
MRKRERPRFGDLEMQIMNVLWERGPATVREVLEALPTRPVPAYTTVLTMLRVMQEKGFVGRDESGRAHVYYPAVRERQVKRNLVRDLVRTAFRGSPEALLMRLLEDEKLSGDELARIQQVIERKSREG